MQQQITNPLSTTGAAMQMRKQRPRARQWGGDGAEQDPPLPALRPVSCPHTYFRDPAELPSYPCILGPDRAVLHSICLGQSQFMPVWRCQ